MDHWLVGVVAAWQSGVATAPQGTAGLAASIGGYVAAGSMLRGADQHQPADRRPLLPQG